MRTTNSMRWGNGAVLLLIALALAACGGGKGGDGGTPVGNQPPVVSAGFVQQVAATASQPADDQEPMSIEPMEATQSDNAEPVPVD